MIITGSSADLFVIHRALRNISDPVTSHILSCTVAALGWIVSITSLHTVYISSTKLYEEVKTEIVSWHM